MYVHSCCKFWLETDEQLFTRPATALKCRVFVMHTLQPPPAPPSCDKSPFAPSSTDHCSTRANIEPWAAHPRTSPRPDTGRLSVAGDAAFVSAAVAAAHRHLPPSTRRPKNPAVRPPRLQSTSNRPSSPTLTRTTPSASTSRSRISPSSAATPASAPTSTSSASTASAAPTAP